MQVRSPLPETSTADGLAEAGPGPAPASYPGLAPFLASSRSIPALDLGSLALLLVLVLSVFAVAPLLYPGYLQTHAGFSPLWNTADLRSNLGQWDWLPRSGLSFDPFRSDGLLFYYLAALLPLPLLASVKAAPVLAWLLGSAGMYLWLKNWLGRPGALVAALVYTYLPYRLAAVYVRGAWGEALFWGLLPWALWAAISFRPTASPFAVRRLPVYSPAQSPVGFLCVAGLWILLGFSHLGLTWWAGLLVLVFWLALYPRRAAAPVLAVLSGAAAATGLMFTLTAPTAPYTAPADHLLYLSQLFSAGWGFGFSRAGWDDGLSLQLGLAAVGLSILSVILWPRRQSAAEPTGPRDYRLLFFLVAAVVLALLQLTLVGFIWRLPLGPSSTLAYPWQLLGLAGLCLAVLAGTTLWLDEELAQPALFGAITVFVILSSYSYLEPQFIPAGQVVATGPQAVVGDNQLVLLDHQFAVPVSANTAGLATQDTAQIPLAVYGPLQANGRLILKTTWQPLRPFSQDLKIFAHLVGPQGEVLAQFDGQPQAGEHPTTRWVPGELINDAYTLVLPAELPPGPYRLFLGLYDETSMARLPVAGDGEGRILLDVR